MKRFKDQSGVQMKPHPAFFCQITEMWAVQKQEWHRVSSVLPPFTRAWMKQKHEETPSSLLWLLWKGDSCLTCPTHFAVTVISSFPVHAHASLMSLWSHLWNDPERPAPAASLTGPGAHYWNLLGHGPHLDYEWDPNKKARYAPSGSNTHPDSAAGCLFQQHEEPNLNTCTEALS